MSEFDEYENLHTQRNHLENINVDGNSGPILDKISDSKSFSIRYDYGNYFTNYFDDDVTKKQKLEFNYELAFKVTRTDIEDLIEYYEYPVFNFTVVAIKNIS